MKAILLTQLTARSVNGEHNEMRGALQTILHEIAEGCFVHVQLGPAGLVVRHGDSVVALPLDELVQLAQQHCPDLKPAPVAAPLSSAAPNLKGGPSAAALGTSKGGSSAAALENPLNSQPSSLNPR